MRVAQQSVRALTEQINGGVVLNHPYGRPVIGWHHEIEKLRPEDALALSTKSLLRAEQFSILVIRGRRRCQRIPPRNVGKWLYGAFPHIRPFRASAAARRAVPRPPRTGLFRPGASNRPACGRITSSIFRENHRRPSQEARRLTGWRIDGRRLQLLPLSRAWYRQPARDQCRRRLSGHLARSVAFSRSRGRRSGVEFAQIEQVIDQRDPRRVHNPPPAPTDSRVGQTQLIAEGCDLRPVQPCYTCALVWLRAHTGAFDRTISKLLARPDSRRQPSEQVRDAAQSALQ